MDDDDDDDIDDSDDPICIHIIERSIFMIDI
jgi:hypothetical protein